MFDENNLPCVTIGCPVANRKYLINRYLDALLHLDYPKNKIKLYFLINNCNDGTDDELRIFKNKHKNKYMDITLEKYRMPFKKDMRVTQHRIKVYERLAELRNYVLSKIDTEYFFSVDSDIIVNPNVLIELLKADKDIIAATINNDKILRPYATHPEIRTNLLINEMYGENKSKITHYMDFPLNEIIEVDYTGAVYLMTKKVASEVKYEFDKQGEDIPFCRNARNLGYKIYAHTGLWQNHIMCEYQDYCISNKCQRPCIGIDQKTRVYQYKYIDNVVCSNLAMCGKLQSGSIPLLNNFNFI